MFNPLFDKKPTERTEVAAGFEVIARKTIPLSPVTNKPMVKAFCGDIPVFVDLETRVVLPTKE